MLSVKLLSPHARVPTRGSPLAAGYDIYAARDVLIPGGDRELVATDLSMEIPRGCYGRLAPRSGLAWKHGIDVGAGVIDADFRGNVHVLLFNFCQEPFQVRVGDRIAQLILEKCEIVLVNVVEELPDTTRGDKGFGSTGV
jgi:dUTP pyrophosphatase